jgi:hypothetical protein
MNIILNRPHKPEESQKNSNFNRKIILYLELEPGTSAIPLGNLNHLKPMAPLVDDNLRYKHLKNKNKS